VKFLIVVGVPFEVNAKDEEAASIDAASEFMEHYLKESIDKTKVVALVYKEGAENERFSFDGI
jgi:hypothetical protein